jgi:WD40-like Beta Propeller Repeat
MEPLKNYTLNGTILLVLVVLSVSCNMPATPTTVLGEDNASTATRVLASSMTPHPSTPTPAPQTPTSTLTPSPTFIPTPIVTRLTDGSCCTGPFWSPDSNNVWYIDRPSPEERAGIWGVSLQGGLPEFITAKLGIYSDDLAYRAFPQGGETVVERMADGQRWNLANGARAVAFSPDDRRLAWTAGQSGPPFDTPVREIWISNIDGTDAHMLLQMYGGGLLGWQSENTLLVNGRESPEASGIYLWSLSADTSAIDEILQVPAMRGGILSPDRHWLAYQVVFSGEAETDGLWLADLETAEHRRLDLFGAYKWRTAGQLLVIPFEPESSVHQLWQVEALTGETRPLTDPLTTPIRIANGDWAVSPDGRYMAWVSALDQNIWVLDLPY